jgi:hypothetical protein
MSTTSFVDSIVRKDELSIQQIRDYTNLDSVYYTGYHSYAAFTGDTVVNLHGNPKGLIIDYEDGRICHYKFLFVYDPITSRAVDYKNIYLNCDHEEDSGYYVIKYEFLNDSVFKTIGDYISENGKLDKRKLIKWKVDLTGRIVTLH